MSHVPDWLQWLNYLLWPVVVLSILLVFGYFFDDRQLDSRAVQRPAGGTAGSAPDRRYPPDVGVFGIMKDIPRIMKREWQKLAVSAARHRAVAALLYSRRWPDGSPGTLVPVQRMDAGDSIL